MTVNERFKKFLGSADRTNPILPAVHTTTVTSFGQILDSGVISLTECKYYHEDLLYFFYGKPAYKISSKNDPPTKIVGDAAVTFVFAINKLPEIHRSFAFDTGACFGSRYDELLPVGVCVEDFELDGDPVTFAQFVATFFGKNRDYYVGEPRVKPFPSPLDVVSNAVRDITSSVSSNGFDERACTCEIQFKNEVQIHASEVITVILPDILFDDAEVRIALKKWNVKPILYRMKRAIPSERTEVIAERLGDFYEEEGYM